MKTIMYMALVFALLAVCGCATRERRIERNRQLYESYPIEVQDQIMSGSVEIGFTKDMVFLALGNPDFTHTRTTADGQSIVWIYGRTTPRFNYGLSIGNRYPLGYGLHYYGPAVHHSRVFYPILHIEFRDGSVIAIEQTDP